MSASTHSIPEASKVSRATMYIQDEKKKRNKNDREGIYKRGEEEEKKHSSVAEAF